MEQVATGRENLVLQAQLYGMGKKTAADRAQELIERLGLSAFADRKASTYSGGQRRIFDLGAGVIHKPELLFLDEPTTGLDPQSRARVWEEVKRLRDEGTTIFLTTHYLEEADVLCDRVAIIDEGQIVALDSPAALKRAVAGDRITLGLTTGDDAHKAAEVLRKSISVKEAREQETSLIIYVDGGDTVLPEILKVFDRASLAIKSVQLSRPTLDDVFLKLTGRQLRAEEGGN